VRRRPELRLGLGLVRVTRGAGRSRPRLREVRSPLRLPPHLKQELFRLRLAEIALLRLRPDLEPDGYEYRFAYAARCIPRGYWSVG
jgi:hypothetical protein